MIIPVGEGVKQQMQKITKLSDSETKIEKLGVFSFVPMLEDKVK